MADLQTLSINISGAIQAAKSATSEPELSQPEFFRSVLGSFIDLIPENWASEAKHYFREAQNPSLEDVAAVLNEDIRNSSTDVDRCMIYQLLLRLSIVVYGIESNLMRSNSPLGGVLS